MRIGIDIDGVLTNMEQFMLDYATKYCYENNLPIKINVHEYNEVEMLNMREEQTIKFWNTYLGEYVTKYPMREFAKSIIDKLKKDGNEIYIVTARSEYGLPEELYGKMSELTVHWLKKNDVNYDKIFFTKDSKMQAIEENNIDIMIDDSPKNIKELSTKIPVLCYHAQYNSDIKGENIIRVYGWYDIYEKIQEKYSSKLRKE